MTYGTVLVDTSVRTCYLHSYKIHFWQEWFSVRQKLHFTKVQEKLLNTISFLNVLKSDWRYILDLIKSHCWNLILSSDKDTCWFKFHWTNTELCYDQILFKFKKLVVVVFLLLLCVAIEKILAEKLFIWMRDGHLPFVNNWTANYRA